MFTIGLWASWNRGDGLFRVHPLSITLSQEMRFMKPELNKYLWNELYQWTESFLIVSENNLTFS